MGHTCWHYGGGGQRAAASRGDCGSSCAVGIETRAGGATARSAAAMCVLALLVVGFGQVGVANALSPESEQNIESITDHLYRGTPYTSVPCGTVCDTLWTAEHADQTQPSLDEPLQRELRTLRIKVGLNPSFDGSCITLSTSTNVVGMRINGPSAKYLKRRIPFQQTAVGSNGQPTTWTSMCFRRTPHDLYSGAMLEESGWLPRFGETERWFDAPCEFAGYNPPIEFAIRGPIASTGNCLASTLAQVRHGFIAEHGLQAVGPVEQYTGVDQPYQVAGSVTGAAVRSSVRDLALSELRSGRYPVASAWYDAQLGSAAHNLRPLLFFDSAERWRPLNAERFLGEGGRFPGADHRQCASKTGGPCTTIQDWTDLRLFGSDQSAAHLELAQDPTLPVGDDARYRSPDANCIQDRSTLSPAQPTRLDCDSGPDSAIYSHETNTFDDPLVVLW